MTTSSQTVQSQSAKCMQNKRAQTAIVEKRRVGKDGKPRELNPEEEESILNKLKSDIELGVYHNINWFLDEVWCLVHLVLNLF
jgi:hypothetical protein